MSRNVSALFREAVYRPETGEVPVVLITLDHPDLLDPIRVSTDNADTFVVGERTVRGTISNGNNFAYCPVRITLPDDSEETISEASLEIDNVERSIMAAIRALQAPPTITMQAVLASTPDVIEAQWLNFKLADVEADALVISGKLSLGNFLGEPYPGGSMLPSNFPGLF
jgi:hypothetical protein